MQQYAWKLRSYFLLIHVCMGQFIVGVGWVKICCSVGLKGAVQRFGLMAELSTVLFSAEGWQFILSLMWLVVRNEAGTSQPRVHGARTTLSRPWCQFPIVASAATYHFSQADSILFLLIKRVPQSWRSALLLEEKKQSRLRFYTKRVFGFSTTQQKLAFCFKFCRIHIVQAEDEVSAQGPSM